MVLLLNVHPNWDTPGVWPGLWLVLTIEGQSRKVPATSKHCSPDSKAIELNSAHNHYDSELYIFFPSLSFSPINSIHESHLHLQSIFLSLFFSRNHLHHLTICPQPSDQIAERRDGSDCSWREDSWWHSGPLWCRGQAPAGLSSFPCGWQKGHPLRCTRCLHPHLQVSSLFSLGLFQIILTLHLRASNHM